MPNRALGIGRVPERHYTFRCKICKRQEIGLSKSAAYCLRPECVKKRAELLKERRKKR